MGKDAKPCPECGRPCIFAEADKHHSCGWCGECHPEVPEWT